MTLRIIWGAMLMGQLMFLGVIFAIFHPAWTAPPSRTQLGEPPPDILLYASIGLLVICVIGAFAIRAVVFNANRDEQGLIKPGGYATGTIIYMAMLEGASFFGLVNIILHKALWPHILIAGIAIVLQLIAFPTGNNVAETGTDG